jgi:hypothetical protein
MIDVGNRTNCASVFCAISGMKIKGKIRGGYAEGYKTRLSLMKSMVPAGGIEPTAQIENA